MHVHMQTYWDSLWIASLYKAVGNNDLTKEINQRTFYISYGYILQEKEDTTWMEQKSKGLSTVTYYLLVYYLLL